MRQRHGFTLVEVLVSLVIMGIVTGAVYQLLTNNQRLSQAQAEQVSLQSNVRTGSLVVPNELRELNTWVGGTVDRNDITVAEPDRIEYRAMRGLGFTCLAAGAGANQLVLAVETWGGLRVPDATRDDLYLFVDGIASEDEDDGWLQVDVTGTATSGNVCGGEAGYVLTVPAAVIPAVPQHTPVRLFEVMELKLHEEDGAWWLGGRSVSAAEAMQPVLGPLTDDGFQLEYLNSAGVATADLTAIASVRLTVRGLTDAPVRIGGTGAMGHPQEALVTQVLLRNSIRP